MPRGRHRHSPPLHRLLPPSAIAGVSLVCASGPWVFSEPLVLRSLSAAAAATAVVGAVVMRRWDTHAGKEVADLARARAGDEWRHEERVAELETDLEESRELRGKLEQRLRAKRAELTGLRNEHAALLRRYATAETERASALEGRRLLELEAVPTRALPPAAGPVRGTAESRAVDSRAVEFRAVESKAVESGGGGARAVEAGAAGSRALGSSQDVASGAVAAGARAADSGSAAGEPEAPAGRSGAAGERPAAPAVFSPEGSELFRRAQAALSRFADAEGTSGARTADGAEASEARTADGEGASGARTADGEGASGARSVSRSAADGEEAPAVGPAVERAFGSAPAAAPEGERRVDGVTRTATAARPSTDRAEPVVESVTAPAAAPAADSTADSTAESATGPAVDSVPEDEAEGKPEAVAAHEHAAAGTTPEAAASTGPVQRPAGHFTVPTAVAVVPAAAPTRRPAAEGGFDFFGMEKGARSAPSDAPSAPLDAVQAVRHEDAVQAVQHEDLADVVGQEALALHEAESGAASTSADERTRDSGEVIDLTAHDETEQIDLQGLRSAAS
ncbi:hypothetical protein ACFC09_34405 [Streptomyces sp. NPDC056161]|uniref:hypothetical protein n=1 Tax=Streptomyces sp. NPDC056161 TaxID=3345732 RepID=UPI0035DE3088